jgi:ubiquinone biosynthesis protein UbiJ
MNDQTSIIDRLSRVTGDVAGSQVVSAGKERAEKAKRAARAQWPATREDLQRVQDQLDRIEATLAELSARIEAPATKPRRKTASASGSAKTES